MARDPRRTEPDDALSSDTPASDASSPPVGGRPRAPHPATSERAAPSRVGAAGGPRGADAGQAAPISWHRIEAELLELAAADLEDTQNPRPTLAAHAGEDPVAVVGLRPFGPGGVTTALIEVLALLLPLGVDRLAFLAPARVWSSQDPIPPVCDGGDLRQQALVLTTADAHGGPCRMVTSVHPFSLGDGIRWDPPLREDAEVQGPVASTLMTLLEARKDIERQQDDQQLTAQFARVLLLGHELALTEDVADRLTALAASTDAVDPAAMPADRPVP